MEKIFVYHRPDTMKGHTYSDDVAICKAGSKEEAVEKFSKLYSLELLEGHVDECKFSFHGVSVLTSY